MLTIQAAIIALNTSVSSAVSLFDGNVVGLQMPAAWTAAGFQLEASFDGTNFYPLHDVAGNAIGVAAPAAAIQYAIDPISCIGAKYVRVRSGTSAFPVNQLAARTLNIISRMFK